MIDYAGRTLEVVELLASSKHTGAQPSTNQYPDDVGQSDSYQNDLKDACRGDESSVTFDDAPPTDQAVDEPGQSERDQDHQGDCINRRRSKAEHAL